MRLLTPESSRRLPWKNGSGSTLEVATDAPAPGAEWTWRLSIAEVPARTPFSAYPGIDRFIACLTGQGLGLERVAGRGVVPCEGQALSFAGEETVIGEPLGPGVKDVNLMLRRDRWRGRMTLSRGGTLALHAPVVLIHAPFAAVPVDIARDIAPGCTLVTEGGVTVSGAPGNVVVACELSPV